MKPVKIEISRKTIIFIFGFIVLLWILLQIKEILFLLFVSSILSVILEPTVEKLERMRFPRWLSILLLYLLLIFLLGVVVAGIIPPLVEQTSVLVNNLPQILKKINLLGIDQNIIVGQISQLGSIPANALYFLMGFFSNIASVFALAITTFYMLEERKKLKYILDKYFGEETGKKVIVLIERIEGRLGNWTRGELALMTIVGLLSYLGFRLLAMEFALPLAILAGLLEIIPNFGPTLAAIPAVLAGLTMSPLHGLAALAWSFLVQQIENNFIVPKVMQKVTGLSPLVIIVSLGIGFKLAGILGAILAIPVVLVSEVIFSELYSPKLLKG